MTTRSVLATAGLALVAVLAVPACKKHAPEPDTTSAPTPPPDLPRPFGPRCVWLAFHATSSIAVARAMGLHDVAPSGWEKGVAAAYAGQVFVTPPIDGWVLAASARLPDAGGDSRHPDEATPLLKRLSDALGEVQYFGSFDGIGWIAWARFRDGDAVRKFSYLGAQDAVIWNDGEITPAEHALGLGVKAAPGTPVDSGVDDRSVFVIARAWSVDPSTIEERHLGPSLGVIGSL